MCELGGCSCDFQCGDEGGRGLYPLHWSIGNTNVASLTTDPSIAPAGIQANSLGQTNVSVSGYDNNGCYASGSASVVVTFPCFAQLKYRPVPQAPQYNHSFWWIQNSAGAHYVIDGGPTGSSLSSSWGYLNDWVVFGDTGHYTADNQFDAVAWNSSTDPSLCGAVNSLYFFALGWPQNSTAYDPLFGPNSNTFAHNCANAAGSPYVTAPPSAPGW